MISNSKSKPFFTLSASVFALLGSLTISTIAIADDQVTLEAYKTASNTAGTLTKSGAVSFSGKKITIPTFAVEPGKPDTTFEVHGKVNPTILVPASSQLKFELTNMDGGMPHGLVVTTKAPPYKQVPHLSQSDHDDNHEAGLIASTGLSGPADGKTTVIHVRQTKWFKLLPGTYYYVCPVPGHAHKGMYGKIIAK